MFAVGHHLPSLKRCAARLCAGLPGAALVRIPALRPPGLRVGKPRAGIWSREQLWTVTSPELGLRGHRIHTGTHSWQKMKLEIEASVEPMPSPDSSTAFHCLLGRWRKNFDSDSTPVQQKNFWSVNWIL
ncbi:26S Proteasome Non-Atpase Regulatory Subunit 2 [Manis pentadactyla]|nr:26S Proteasome Non-Atpase Regulatory Subunit 2 [Manis pentadactyla]